MPTVKAEPLKELCVNILKAAGTPPDDSEIVADIIVRANLRGVDSHGIRNLPRYIKEIKSGDIVPGATIKVIKENRTREKRLKEGIPLDDVFWDALLETAKDVGVDAGKVVAAQVI